MQTLKRLAIPVLLVAAIALVVALSPGESSGPDVWDRITVSIAARERANQPKSTTGYRPNAEDVPVAQQRR
jgi:hypothetical protein